MPSASTISVNAFRNKIPAQTASTEERSLKNDITNKYHCISLWWARSRDIIVSLFTLAMRRKWVELYLQRILQFICHCITEFLPNRQIPGLPVFKHDIFLFQPGNTILNWFVIWPLNILYNVTLRFLYSFNQLDLPAYETYDKLRRMLLLAIEECTEGFGLA